VIAWYGFSIQFRGQSPEFFTFVANKREWEASHYNTTTTLLGIPGTANSAVCCPMQSGDAPGVGIAMGLPRLLHS